MIYQALFDVVTRAHGDAAFNRELDIDSARSVSEFMLRFTQSNFADVMQYIHYPDYDSYTIGHSVRVSSIAVFLGMKMNWPEDDILAIGTAGILHDIGKSRIPLEILYKAGSLSEEEYRLVRLASAGRRGTPPGPAGGLAARCRCRLGAPYPLRRQRLSGKTVLGGAQPGNRPAADLRCLRGPDGGPPVQTGHGPAACLFRHGRPIRGHFIPVC